MSGTVVPFRRSGRQVPKFAPTIACLAVNVSACAGDVVLGIDDVEVDLDPAQARELARDLLELAAAAEADRG